MEAGREIGSRVQASASPVELRNSSTTCRQRLFPSLSSAITIIEPETVMRWHRAGFRLSGLGEAVFAGIWAAAQLAGGTIGRRSGRTLSICSSTCLIGFGCTVQRPTLARSPVAYRHLLDAEGALFDDTRHTMFARSSAINSPPERSTAKPTGLPRA
jgi:hypothetical protein